MCGGSGGGSVVVVRKGGRISYQVGGMVVRSEGADEVTSVGGDDAHLLCRAEERDTGQYRQMLG